MPAPPLPLADRVALVTGAAAGIGAATSCALAAAGAHVALCDRDAEGLGAVADSLTGLGRRAWQGVFDVRDPEAVRDFVAEVTEGDRPIHVLVNNAGGGFRADLLDVSEKGELALIRENFTSVTSFVRAVVPHMPQGGSIVNVTSIEARRAAPGYAVYAAMKAAVESLSRSLALELGARHIRVNSVAPDVIPTPGIGTPPVTTPLPRAGSADDVAAAIVFLASDAAGFVTGASLPVDGGNAAAGGWRRRSDGSFEP